MRIKKIRGHKRRWKHIDLWLESNKSLDINYLKRYQRDYVKIRIHPWSSISLINSKIPEPSGQTKTKVLKALLEIYNSWKIELDQLDQEYYLKIWLFEPRFSNSQVVCAIGNYLDFYQNTFSNPDQPKELKAGNYGQLMGEMTSYKWENRLDEDHIDNTDIGDPEICSIKKGDVWLGEKY